MTVKEWSLKRLFVFFLIAFLLTYLVRVLEVSTPFIAMVEIDSLIYQRDQLLENNLELQKRLLKLEQNLVENKDVLNNIVSKSELKTELEHYQELAGFSKMTGEGIIILVDDASGRFGRQNIDTLLVHDSTLNNIIGELRTAGAEAIAINDTRIVFGLSEIVCSGPTINIDRIDHAPPFVIKALGDSHNLQRALSTSDAYTQALQYYGLQLEINTCRQLEVDAYNGISDYGYASIKE